MLVLTNCEDGGIDMDGVTFLLLLKNMTMTSSFHDSSGCNSIKYSCHWQQIFKNESVVIRLFVLFDLLCWSPLYIPGNWFMLEHLPLLRLLLILVQHSCHHTPFTFLPLVLSFACSGLHLNDWILFWLILALVSDVQVLHAEGKCHTNNLHVPAVIKHFGAHLGTQPTLVSAAYNYSATTATVQASTVQYMYCINILRFSVFRVNPQDIWSFPSKSTVVCWSTEYWKLNCIGSPDWRAKNEVRKQISFATDTIAIRLQTTGTFKKCKYLKQLSSRAKDNRKATSKARLFVRSNTEFPKRK